MQRIERYGVIALVFLLVTILAVAVWGQRKNQSLLSFLKRDKPTTTAQVDPQAPVSAPGSDLGLSDPAHVLLPAVPQGTSGQGVLDPALTLPQPAGPGASAVNFGNAPGTAPITFPPPTSGFVDGTGQGLSTPTQPQPAVASAERTYKVKSGDTLGSIAKRELGSTKRWSEISALNNVQPERLKVGMLLKLPSGAAVTTASVEPNASPDVLVKREAPPAPKSGKTYNVRPGDSLSKIAAAQLGDVNRYAEILALNPGLDPARLQAGKTLRMPADAKVAGTERKPKARSTPTEPEIARADTSSRKPRVQ